MRLSLTQVFFSFILFYSSAITLVNCWEDYELDLFDLVEEVNDNFYEFMGVEESASNKEIKSKYRKLSLIWHPDKSDDPGAELKFRHIVAIYEVLKDPVKRNRYNDILENGLPDWRTPLYYFRKVRKLTTLELSIAIAIIISIAHYCFLYAQHFEAKLTIEDRMGDIRKSIEKKRKKRKECPELDSMDEKLQSALDSLDKPSFKSILPYRLVKWSFAVIISIPALIKDKIQNRQQQDNDDSDDSGNESTHEEQRVTYRAKKMAKNESLQRSLNPKNIEKSKISAVVSTSATTSAAAASNQNNESTKMNSKKEWSDKEKGNLIKAISKYPPGTTSRWNKISEFVETRTPSDCIQMEKNIKTNITSSLNSHLNANTWSQLSEKDNNDNDIKVVEWSQQQQVSFEEALKTFNKDVPNRWEKIAESVPGKNKEDCIQRFKHLCAALKKS